MKKTIRWITLTVSAGLVLIAATLMYSRSWKRALFTTPLYRIETTEKVIALTFDDGPSPVRTPPLLDLLKEHDVHATFFMLGENIQRYPDIARRVAEDGHLIGNHSYDHPKLIFRSPRFIREQLLKTDSLIRELGPEETKYIRPPNSSKYITLPLILSSMDKTLVTGSYDPPSEYAPVYDAEKVAGEVIDNVEPGSIIYLHDGPGRDAEAFIESVELIIAGLKKLGFSFVRIDYEENLELTTY